MDFPEIRDDRQEEGDNQGKRISVKLLTRSETKKKTYIKSADFSLTNIV